MSAGSGACCGVGAFTDAPGPAVDFGPGALAGLGHHVRALGVAEAVVVTDPGLVATGLVDDAVVALRGAGCAVAVIDEIPGNPTVDAVAAGARRAREAFPGGAVVALGGGSALDAAKGIALLAADPSLDVTGAPTRPGRPVVAVPTTAGTGAETNGFGVLEDPRRRCKVYVGDASVVPRVAVLDPLVTRGLPAGATAATGVDALVHGIESLVSRGRTPVSEAFAAEAVARVWRWLPTAVADGSDDEARAQMLVGAHLAGQALTRSGLGLVHGLGHALTAHTGMVHGRALGAVLPEVTAYSLDADPAGFARVAAILGVAPSALPDVLASRCSSVGVAPALVVSKGPLLTSDVRNAPSIMAGEELDAALVATALADPVTTNTPRLPDAADLHRLLTRCRGVAAR